MDLTQLWAFLLPLTLSRAEASDTEKPSLDASLEIYKKLFEVKRKDQLNALKNLIELNDVNQQYKIIDIMLKGLFKVLEDSRAILLAADVPPDGPLPQDEKLKDVLPQCRHLPEGPAGGGEAQEERGEAKGDPQGPPDLPLAVRVVARRVRGRDRSRHGPPPRGARAAEGFELPSPGGCPGERPDPQPGPPVSRRGAAGRSLPGGEAGPGAVSRPSAWRRRSAKRSRGRGGP
ncbi:coiled-coil domain-containing protein 134 isoform X1 [Ornithorhynchus anatinus]|uniref:coiled-coil domain-containing protein 134 isoform X1 n=1 Tax=Ornithorhynchus anatinus TaxID=9258 RepID=UPI0019D4CC8E|nr:coiled-coil domain-containing protein 134 isoform X1 [Ornithorhynchus anatinus]XP_039770032.1 coiled-coil domain-containing protein 134 isoform X1 [Ornithorhynchus anatinus]XP_039770033.1 coiled-coil domain-containing protein 134 isoform X1 [Ornithorhynchus anatinus]XP_039770034.1 coiled-coil domain-containing protein 134 isoform X1 [Ornithorhynchus anatinus]XP_039770035.1 coiled-coil domain-containing protein 134 isoform X1 [Ornithorhynchus anatinus]